MPKALTLAGIESNDPITRVFQIEARGKELLKDFGLDAQGWKFNVSHSQSRLGVCKHSRKLIEFSEHYAHIEWSEIEDTLLHEIAHALVGPNHGHDSTWKAKCIEIGAKPERLADEHIRSGAEHNYRIYCTSCGHSFKRYRLRPALLERYRCGKCGGKFDAELL